MNRRKAAAAIALAPLAAGQKRSDVRKKFVGVWRLVSYESKDKSSGAVSYPYSARPFGRLTYDAAGRMSAQLMHPGRRPVGGSPTLGTLAVMREASCEQMRDMLGGFMAYCGTFDVDEASRMVIHHVQASLIPSWVGKDQFRGYEFAGDKQLVLTSVTDQRVGRLVWQREES